MPKDEKDSKDIERFQYFLKPGFVFLSQKPALISTVLGSAVTVCLWDRKNRFGGMAHFLYPEMTKPRQTTTQYGNVAVWTLIQLLINAGSKKKSLEAQIFGGGDPFSVTPETLGNQNSFMAKKILLQQGIPISSEDVGGRRGRKLIFKSDTNEALVLKVERLRQEDWFPYGEARQA